MTMDNDDDPRDALPYGFVRKIDEKLDFIVRVATRPDDPHYMHSRHEDIEIAKREIFELILEQLKR